MRVILLTKALSQLLLILKLCIIYLESSYRGHVDHHSHSPFQLQSISVIYPAHTHVGGNKSGGTVKSKIYFNSKFSYLFLLLVIFFCACEPSQAELDAAAPQAADKQHATQTAITPAATLTPTDTPTPTNTAAPTDTRTPTSTPSPTLTPLPGMVITPLDNGWNLYESNAEGFSIALPPEWLHIDLNPDTISNTLALNVELNPQINELVSSEAIELAANGIKFYGIDSSVEAIDLGIPSSINILSIDLGVEIPLALVVVGHIEQLENRIADPGYPVAHQRLSITDLEAEQFVYARELMGYRGNLVKGLLHQYFLVDGSTHHIITLRAPLELRDFYSDTFDEIGKSFKLLNENN